MAIMDQLLDPDVWKAVGASITAAPLVNIPLLIIVGFIGYWFRGREDRGKIGGLEERLRARDDQLSARDERLLQARENEKDVTAKLAVAKEETLALQKQVTLYAHKDNALATIETSVVRTVAAIQDATTSSDAMRRTLTFGPTFGYEPPKPSTTLKSSE